MHAKFPAYVQLSAAMMTVGSTVIASKIIGQGIDPFLATALRFAIALPVFLALLWMSGTRFPQVGCRDLALLIGQAATGSVGYTILLIAGSKLTAAADAGVIIGTLPAAAVLTALLFLGEKPTGRTLGAVALATAGALLVISGSPAAATRSSSVVGDLLILGAVFCECFFILLNKRLSRPWPPLALSAAMTGLGLVISILFAASSITHVPSIPISSLLAVLYYALIPTVAGFWLWYSGSARVSGGEAAIFTAIAPATTVVLAWLFFGEQFTPVRIGGLATVFAAVAVAAVPRKSGKGNGDRVLMVPDDS